MGKASDVMTELEDKIEDLSDEMGDIFEIVETIQGQLIEIKEINSDVDDIEDRVYEIEETIKTLKKQLKIVEKKDKSDVLVVEIDKLKKGLKSVITEIGGIKKLSNEIKNLEGKILDIKNKKEIVYKVPESRLPEEINILRQELSEHEEEVKKIIKSLREEILRKVSGIYGEISLGAGSRISDVETTTNATRSSEKIQSELDTIQAEVDAIDASVTLADISLNSTDATKSLYTMSAGIPVNFKSSDGNTLLYLDETNERVGVGTASPLSNLHVYNGAGGGSTPTAGTDLLTLENSTTAYINIVTPANASGGIYFSDNTRGRGSISYNHNTDVLQFGRGGTGNEMVLSGTGLGIGQTTPSSKLDITTNSLGVTQTTTSGLALVNTTAASAGAQQISPAVRWTGQGWKTDATAASQAVEFIADVLPVQGTANPSGTWQLKSSINGGAYSNVLNVTSAGNVGIGTTSPSSKLHVLGTTEQLRLSYDASNYASFTVATNGLITISPNGSAGYLNVKPTNNYGIMVRNSGNDAYYSSLGTPGDYLQLKYKEVGTIVINNSGNVGIGTTGPLATLHVVKSDAATDIPVRITRNHASFNSENEATLQLDTGANNLQTRLNFTVSGIPGASIRSLNAVAGSPLNTDLTFLTKGASGSVAEWMRITSAGLVGIGTTSPGNKLHIFGTKAGGAGSPTTPGLTLHDSSTAAQGVGGGILFTGNYTGTTTTTAGAIQAFKETATAGEYGFAMTFHTRENGLGNWMEKMRISGNGNVGIGTNDPDSKLEVDGSIITTAATDTLDVASSGSGVQFRGTSNGSYFWQIRRDSTSSDLHFDKNYGGVSTNAITLQRSTGNVGIGTTNPQNKLEVIGDVRISTVNTDATIKSGRVISSQYNSTAEPEGFMGMFLSGLDGINRVSVGGGSSIVNAASSLYFYTAADSSTLTGSVRMAINSAGNVGIGTTSPDRLLHAEVSDAITNAVTYAQRLSHITSGTATTSFGTGIEYELENASGTNRVAGTEEFTWSDATDASEDATYTLKLMRAGTLATGLTVASNGAVTAGASFFAAAGNDLGWTGRSTMESPADGVIVFYNAAYNNFSRLQFGGTTASFPSIKRSGTGLQVRLANDSADAALTALTIKATQAAGYISSDGSAGATGTFTTVDGKTCTVKDGLITSIV